MLRLKNLRRNQYFMSDINHFEKTKIKKIVISLKY